MKTFSPAQIAAAKAAAAPAAVADGIDWAGGVVTPGGGVSATIGALRKARGKNKKPTKEQVALRLDPEVLAAFRAVGPGWQTRMNAVLKEWLSQHPPESLRAWLDEALHREQELASGKVAMVPGREAVARIRAQQP